MHRMMGDVSLHVLSDFFGFFFFAFYFDSTSRLFTVYLLYCTTMALHVAVLVSGSLVRGSTPNRQPPQTP